jgi:hypothetical protein
MNHFRKCGVEDQLSTTDLTRQRSIKHNQKVIAEEGLERPIAQSKMSDAKFFLKPTTQFGLLGLI